MTESAIPDHLRQVRTQSSKEPPNYEPSYPAYTARFPVDTKELVMAVIGTQVPSSSSVSEANDALKEIISFTSKGPEHCRPKFQDLASVIDASGWYNACVIAYWSNSATYSEWNTESGFNAWWESLDSQAECGWFREVFFPSIDRLETLFSSHLEGSGQMLESMSGPISEHVYWGSMRDRLPLSQTDALVGEKWLPQANGEDTPSNSRRVRLPGKKNLAVIRSGQDWSATLPEERKLYLETMQPVLVKGMTFLRDSGDAVGCYSCRLMDVLDPVSMKPETDRTFGLAYFDDLASLEGWSREHKTHLDIFGGFLQYVQKLDNNVSLRLFHEVLVLKPEQQLFEYVGCHPQTGMLRSL
jgi:Haem-containing dehydratase